MKRSRYLQSFRYGARGRAAEKRLSLENVRDMIRDAAARNGIDVLETAAFVPCVSDYYYDGCVHPAF